MERTAGPKRSKGVLHFIDFEISFIMKRVYDTEKRKRGEREQDLLTMT
jgi:hypothetical protein